ncbi:MAG TPA: shikimate kinase [Candidatus Lustribacter sp.]|nr:shikimate kinase [Candidatus Lustribacter sp.]
MHADPVRHILFCGTAGSGKTTVGALVARALGRDFVDVDRAVERAAGMSVATIFTNEGEAAFRVRERAAVVAALAGAKPAVISLGGGALENDDTFADARRHTLVWLKATVPTLATRLSGNGDRPLLTGDPLAKLHALAAEREPRYRQAHVIVDASLAPKGVAASVLEALRASEMAGERA